MNHPGNATRTLLADALNQPPPHSPLQAVAAVTRSPAVHGPRHARVPASHVWWRIGVPFHWRKLVRACHQVMSRICPYVGQSLLCKNLTGTMLLASFHLCTSEWPSANANPAEPPW